jgi:hypothetical protein
MMMHGGLLWGWAAGSELMSVIIGAVKKHTKADKARRKFYKPIIEAFIGHGCDTFTKCWTSTASLTPLIKKIYSDDFEDDDQTG